MRSISNGLVKAIQPVLASLETFTDVGDLPEAVNKLDDRHIENAYREMYQRTLPDFAVQSYRQVRPEKNEAILRDLWEEEIERYIASGVIADRIVHVANTTKERIRGLVQKGIDEGMSIQQIASGIDELGVPQIIRNRSTVIARTETINASNRGSLFGAQSTGLDLWKEWLATPGARTRDDHADADGDRAELNGVFYLGDEQHEAEFPGDPNLPPEQCINCRCTITYIPK